MGQPVCLAGRAQAAARLAVGVCLDLLEGSLLRTSVCVGTCSWVLRGSAVRPRCPEVQVQAKSPDVRAVERTFFQ